MLYNRMEKWDDIDDVAIEWMREKGLLPVLTYIAEKMRDAWLWRDHKPFDGELLDETYEENAYALAHDAYGAYNALLVSTGDRDDVWHAIYNWGHYSVFY